MTPFGETPKHWKKTREQEHDNSNGYAPMGLQAWLRVLTVSGPLGAIAMFTVWIWANMIPKMQQDLVVIQQQNTLRSQFEVQHTQRTEELYRLMMQVCANTAKDSQERKSCFDR